MLAPAGTVSHTETDKAAAWPWSQEYLVQRGSRGHWLWRPRRERNNWRTRLRLTGGSSVGSPPSSHLGNSPICVCRRGHVVELRPRGGIGPVYPAVKLRDPLFSGRNFGREQDGG